MLLFFCLGQYESNRGEERTLAPAIGVEEERNVGIALQRQYTGEPIKIRQAGRLYTIFGATRFKCQQNLQLHRIPQDRAHQQSAQLGARVWYQRAQASFGYSQ